jgi:hypothetical protein
VILPAGAVYGPPGPLPSGARVFDAGGPGVAEHFDGVSWPAGKPAPILVVERREVSTDGDKALEKKSASHAALVGLDVPYSLTVRLGN